MNTNIKGIKINYEIYGQENSKEILILHGWGANIQSFAPVSNKLGAKFKVYVLDLPGFGESDEPNEAFYVEDYANVVLEFIKEHNMTPDVFIDELKGIEKFIFKKVYGGKLSKKMYRLFEYKY